MLAARGQRDIEDRGGAAGILEKQLEEIPHSVEQQRIARLFPQAQILRHHWGGFRIGKRGHALD